MSETLSTPGWLLSAALYGAYLGLMVWRVFRVSVAFNLRDLEEERRQLRALRYDSLVFVAFVLAWLFGFMSHG